MRVRRLSIWVHAGPGLVIGAVFGLIAAYNRPLHIGYVVAAVGAVVTGILGWSILRIRLSRTDAAFCHACLMPLAVAGILSTFLVDVGSPRQKVESYVATAIMLGIVAFADRWAFRNYGFWLLRPSFRQNLVGAPLDILNQVQAMIEPDWDRLREHYVALDPLYKHAAARLSQEDSGVGQSSDQGQEAPDLQ